MEIEKLIAAHQYQAVLDYFQAVGAPQGSRDWAFQGEALINLGQYAAAQAAFAQAVNLGGESADLWVSQSVCYLHLEKPEKALTCCNRALVLMPRHERAALFRGVALQQLNRHGEAYASYQQALGAARFPAQKRPLGRMKAGLKRLVKRIEKLAVVPM
ncbi:tetratricopeptide repeat protein [Leptolyngbya sp. PCC 6406]|uniref:tetratricopeptide repeat protein n=1 Tax=Leptolyngbya sp. PCC 6406 TaxID=1173264 RepID=UPI0002AC807E|nr:tetratricopeptide repeat protein [Leptolyngbya sp. PCC 6406]